MGNGRIFKMTWFLMIIGIILISLSKSPDALISKSPGLFYTGWATLLVSVIIGKLDDIRKKM